MRCNFHTIELVWIYFALKSWVLSTSIPPQFSTNRSSQPLHCKSGFTSWEINYFLGSRPKCFQLAENTISLKYLLNRFMKESLSLRPILSHLLCSCHLNFLVFSLGSKMGICLYSLLIQNYLFYLRLSRNYGVDYFINSVLETSLTHIFYLSIIGSCAGSSVILICRFMVIICAVSA
jgi:hypothetical protein